MDTCLSGFSTLGFWNAVSALSETLEVWHPNKLEICDKDGVINECFFHKGAKLGDAFELLEFDYDRIDTISYHVNFPTGPEKCICELYRSNNSRITGISGFLYSTRESECSDQFQNFLCDIALSTKGVVTVGDESDESGVIVLIPCVLAPVSVVASSFPLSTTLRQFLKDNGVNFQEKGDLVTITASGGTFCTSVVTEIREWLTCVSLESGCRWW